MTYAFYPGCVSRGGCPELYPAAMKVATKLRLELRELTDVGCTGAGVLSRDVSDPINARTFARAEQQDLSTIMTICSTCQGVMTQANYRLKNDPEYREHINTKYLAEEGLAYEGTVEVKHLLWVLMEDYGLDNLKPQIVRPLTGLKVAPFYGCYLRRPSDLMAPQGFAGRKTYLEDLIRLVGAEVTDFGGKSKCCGFPILTANEDNSLQMASDHTSEAKSNGADCMVTPCPLCHLHLDGNQPNAEKKTKKRIGLPILHLPQLVGLALGFDEQEMELQRHLVPTEAVVHKVKVNMLS
jgi:succinate dehydrogenase / fumarate reductase cytochrome b subunit